MKRKLSKQAVLYFLLLAAPLSAFTYQGRLYDNGSPAQGSYNMYFTLYDALQGGSAVTETYSVPGVSVANGYFTVNLNFPAAESNFNGRARWLEAAMRKAGTTDPLTTLSPRTRLTAVPYAEQARTAERLAPLAFITDHIVLMEIEGEPDRYFHYFSKIKQWADIRLIGTTKLPDNPHLDDIELRRFADQDRSFFDWILQLETTDVRKTIRLSVLDRKGIICEQWVFLYSLPSRVQYDYDPALGAVVQTVVLKAQHAQRVLENIGRFAAEWYPGPQPLFKGPFVITPEGLPAQTYESFRSIGLEAIFTLNNDPIPMIEIDIRSLDPVFVRPAANEPEMADWFQGVVTGQWETRRVGFSFNADERPLVRGTLLQCWPCKVESFIDPVTRKPGESIQIVAQDMVLE